MGFIKFVLSFVFYMLFSALVFYLANEANWYVDKNMDFDLFIVYTFFLYLLVWFYWMYTTIRDENDKGKWGCLLIPALMLLAATNFYGLAVLFIIFVTKRFGLIKRMEDNARKYKKT